MLPKGAQEILSFRRSVVLRARIGRCANVEATKDDEGKGGSHRGLWSLQVGEVSKVSGHNSLHVTVTVNVFSFYC